MASCGEQAAAFKAQDARREAGHPLRVVGGDDDGDADLMEGREDVEEVGRGGAVEVGRGLVGEQDGRTVDHRAGDGQALALAAGQGRRHGVHAMLQAHPGQQLGHVVTVVTDGRSGLAAVLNDQPDVVLLDLGLPVLDGLSLLKWARQRFGALPIMILTARDDIDDRVSGLNAGADDYLAKPFDMKELQARVAALLRRSRLPAFVGSLEVTAGHGRLLRLDSQLPLAWLGDEALDLTQREWAPLSLLVARKGQVISREDVMAVWQQDRKSVV